jgi:hypothetical protein
MTDAANNTDSAEYLDAMLAIALKHLSAVMAELTSAATPCSASTRAVPPAGAGCSPGWIARASWPGAARRRRCRGALRNEGNRQKSEVQ